MGLNLMRLVIKNTAVSFFFVTFAHTPACCHVFR